MSESLLYLLMGIFLWYGAFMHVRAKRYKDAYESICKMHDYIQNEYDRLAAQHYDRRERDRSLASK